MLFSFFFLRFVLFGVFFFFGFGFFFVVVVVFAFIKVCLLFTFYTHYTYDKNVNRLLTNQYARSNSVIL